MVKSELRMDDELDKRVKAAAAADHRSKNGEVLWLLELGLKARVEKL